jgi:hypothetical protein
MDKVENEYFVSIEDGSEKQISSIIYKILKELEDGKIETL